MSRYIWKSVIALAITALSFSGTTARASHIGGGDQNPGLETDAGALAKWQDAKIGLTMHWGPVALRGTEIGWSRVGAVALPGSELIGWSSSEQVPAPDYDALYKEFNPVLFNAEEWAQLLRDSGFRYVALVSKHHDGFVMWDTKQTDYNIMRSAFHRDWLKEISDACRKQGIMFGVYYSILDWYQYDYAGGAGPGSTPNRGGPGFMLDRPPDFERYVSYMKAELKELIQNYGIEDLVSMATGIQAGPMSAEVNCIATSAALRRTSSSVIGLTRRRAMRRHGRVATKNPFGCSIQSPGTLRCTRAIFWTVRSTLAVLPPTPGKHGSPWVSNGPGGPTTNTNRRRTSSAIWLRPWGAAAISISTSHPCRMAVSSSGRKILC